MERNEAGYEEKLKKYKESLVKAEKERDEQEIVLERRIREIQVCFRFSIQYKIPLLNSGVLWLLDGPERPAV